MDVEAQDDGIMGKIVVRIIRVVGLQKGSSNC